MTYYFWYSENYNASSIESRQYNHSVYGKPYNLMTSSKDGNIVYPPNNSLFEDSVLVGTDNELAWVVSKKNPYYNKYETF